MSAAVQRLPPRYDPTPWLVGALVLSFVGHAGYVLSLKEGLGAGKENKPVELVMFEVEPPKPSAVRDLPMGHGYKWAPYSPDQDLVRDSSRALDIAPGGSVT